MWVCSVRLISYQWYSQFLLFNMSQRWRKSAHCQGTTNFWNMIQHEIHTSDHAPVWCAHLKWNLSRNRLASVLIQPSNNQRSAMVVLVMKNADIPLLQIMNSSSAMFALWNNLVTFNQLLDCVLHRFCWSWCQILLDEIISRVGGPWSTSAPLCVCCDI